MCSLKVQDIHVIRVAICESTVIFRNAFGRDHVIRGLNDGLHLTDIDSAAGHTRLRFRNRTFGVIYGRDI